jgi:hypothetical protein
VARSWAALHGYTGEVSCSNGIGGLHPRTPDFVCNVRVHGDVCDELAVERSGGRWHVTLRRRSVDCVLPA